ncbi:PAS domain-containing protein [Methylococcaceae bacterium WWC4]|nr:PAS domain-containing protein [Methylococcaceae bacterium WWC4]
METFSYHQQRQAERLTDAFRAFNALSENLAQSYHGLEEQVTALNRELAAARDERVNTLIEKERLASRLQQILAALPAAVIVLNREGVVIDCNGYAVDFLGEPLLGESWWQVVGRSLQPVFDSPHERQLRDGRTVNITYSALGNGAEQLILLSDVTELRSLQNLLARQKQLSAMGEMVAGLAHQVRTPLSTAILYASQINTPGLSGDKRLQFSAKILERLHYLERQVNDMLIFAKQGRMAMQDFELRSLWLLLADSADALACDFTLEDRSGIARFTGNQDALRGGLLNLLTNAVEAGARRVMLTATAGAAGDLFIEVADDGPGVPEQRRDRLFEPFFTTKANGTGLGLAVVDSVAKAHGGRVSYRPLPGRGSRFTLILPSTRYEPNLSAGIAGRGECYETV